MYCILPDIVSKVVLLAVSRQKNVAVTRISVETRSDMDNCNLVVHVLSSRCRPCSRLEKPRVAAYVILGTEARSRPFRELEKHMPLLLFSFLTRKK